MKVSLELSRAFDASFEARLAQFCVDKGLLPQVEELQSNRFLSRSIVPHVKKLSSLFNRIEPDARSAPKEEKLETTGLDPYWKASSHPENLRLAYLLYFMPCNAYRVASVWTELLRLGYIPPKGIDARGAIRAIEFGSGPASGACGIAHAQALSAEPLHRQMRWALIEQDRQSLKLGEAWALNTISALNLKDWEVDPFHRKIDFSVPLLPPRAPQFDLWLSSYFLNETELAPEVLARKLLTHWKLHLAEEGIVILVEPALRIQSRKLLALRKALLKNIEEHQMQVLLPCLGHQKCDALEDPEDWCHEEVSWWRPPYLRKIDDLALLDRKTLPFSYLVLTKSKRPRDEILPALKKAQGEECKRFVSPLFEVGTRFFEGYWCGLSGKSRARVPNMQSTAGLGRGSIVTQVENQTKTILE